ncbi:MAG: hypothetical protein NT069_10610, partial [Planctomycetota bacterium]|nr:hypothetical protein [Planctomycetota bacterium]
MNCEETDPITESVPDCAAALRILDLARPAETDPAVLASAHVAECDACREISRRRQLFDARVATLCRDVAPPIDGRERLLKALANA